MHQGSTLWGIHAGKTGDADAHFKKDKVVGLGWDRVPDLAQLPDDREAFKSAYRAAYPDRSAGHVTTSASQLYRFVHEVAESDLVAYPSKSDRQVHIGRFVGPYRYMAGAPGGYVHQRPVQWLKVVPRTRYTQGALHELGAALSFFQVKNYLDEHLAIIAGESVATEEEDVETIGLVADEIENTTRDFVLKSLARELKGHPFASFVAHLLELMGYRTRVSTPGPDGGVDIIAHRDELGFEPPIIKVQVKAVEGSTGGPVVQALYGTVEPSEYGLLVTLGDFTKQARAFEHSRANLRLIDGDELVNLVLAHYENLDSRYKGILPLKRLYVPEAVETD